MILTCLKNKVNPQDLDAYLDYVHENSFDFDNSLFVLEIWDRFYYEGTLTNVNIPNQKMQSFLDEHKSTFDMLADEHIKKIELYKNQK